MTRRFGKVPRLRERYVTPRNEDIVEKLQAFAQARGHSMLELAFSWLASRPQVSSVIAGATRVEQVEQNVKAIDWALSAEDVGRIDGIAKGEASHALTDCFLRPRIYRNRFQTHLIRLDHRAIWPQN